MNMKTSNTTVTAVQSSLSTITSSPVENITNDETRIVTDSMLGVGDNIAQGDLYFVRIAGVPSGSKRLGNDGSHVQLAEGDTQGSRHVLEVGNAYVCERADVVAAIKKACGCTINEKYLGPVFETVNGKAYVSHPEHGDHDFRAETVGGSMCIAVVFQRALDAEEREARVID